MDQARLQPDPARMLVGRNGHDLGSYTLFRRESEKKYRNCLGCFSGSWGVFSLCRIWCAMRPLIGSRDIVPG